MTQYERNAIIISTVVSLAGLIASVFFGAGHYFARSAAIVTIVAIAFASLELRAKLATAPDFVEKELAINRSTMVQQGKDQGLDDARCNEVFERVSSEVRTEPPRFSRRPVGLSQAGL
ncbi:hypothetical protein, partial [Xenophilus sp.]|uniref:hypothetical protein n=1 Tax=Xenophilus sp. TaxID=1873499 RepID=UPI0037DD24E2